MTTPDPGLLDEAAETTTHTEPVRWIEGVTPTGVQCEHGVWIERGTYLRPTEPTGEHPECLQSWYDEQARIEADIIAEQYADWYRSQ